MNNQLKYWLVFFWFQAEQEFKLKNEGLKSPVESKISKASHVLGMLIFMLLHNTYVSNLHNYFEKK